MPTATLIPRNGSSSSHPSSVVVTLVSSSSVGSSLCQEVDNSNCKDKDTSPSTEQKIRNSGGDEVSILRSKKKMQGSKEKTVAKKSLTGVKAQIKIRKRKRCSFEGCTNIAQKGGVCVTHGAKVEKKRCSHMGCTNQVVKGGVCITHGAIVKKKHCFFEGCTNQVVKGGVCFTHGATRKCCSFEGCTSQSKKGGVCYRHRSK
jgi:hypothetical protein